MAATAESAHSKQVALFVATIGAFITPFLGSSVTVALPTIGREFAMDAISLSWISTSYLLASAIVLLPAGRLGDIYGRKRLWLCGIVLYTACSLLCAAAPGGICLSFFRGLQAVGGGLIYGTGVAIMSSVYPREERGKVLVIIVAAVYSGLSVVPFLGGPFTAQ